MNKLEIAKMLQARHKEVLNNYSKIKVLKITNFKSDISVDYWMNHCWDITIEYGKEKYICTERPIKKYSAVRKYTIAKLED